MPNRSVVFLLPLFALFLTGLIYFPGLSGGYLFDDLINISENPKLHINSLSWQDLRRAALSSNAGPLGRPISMLSFGINHALTGANPFYFKLTNLIIHLLSGISLFLLTRLLLTVYYKRSPENLTPASIFWISLAVSTAWLLHPFNLTSVLYIVQRMASLAVLFMIWGLIFYAWGRLRQQQGYSGAGQIITGLTIFGGLAALSKENGALLPFLMLTTEWTLFSFQTTNQANRRLLIAFHWIVAILPALFIVIFFIFRFDWLIGTYQYRDFTLVERLLTQARVVWFYIQMILLPDTSQMGLFHDDFIISRTIWQPWTTLPAILGIIALFGLAIYLRKKAPIFTFGVLFFFVGHSMESTIFSLEIAHEHRNYLPSYGLLIILFYYLCHTSLRRVISVKLQPILCSIFIILLAVSTAVRAGYWSSNIDLALVSAKHHPLSGRTNMQAGMIFFNLAELFPNSTDTQKYLVQARQYFDMARRYDNYAQTGSFALIVLDDYEKKPISWMLVDELSQQLKDKPLSPASINALIRLSGCQFEGTCKLPFDVTSQLFKAIVQNPTLKGKPRSQILTLLAQLVITLNDYEFALQLLQEALNLNPNDPQVRVNYAHLLIVNGEYDAAQKELNEAKELDYDLFYQNRINEQEKFLVKMREKKPS